MSTVEWILLVAVLVWVGHSVQRERRRRKEETAFWSWYEKHNDDTDPFHEDDDK